jgi:cytochrome b involved in lipid metabolism/uncharacterized membrane protein
MGLPLHPLVVHAATVLLPLALLGLVLSVLVPRLRPRLAGLSVLGLVAAAAAAWFAEESGESLADRVGVAEDHARYGEILPVLAVLSLVVGATWWRLQSGPPVARVPAWATRVAAVGVVVTAVVTTTFTVLAGHSGAVSVWEPETTAAGPTAAASSAGDPTSSAPTSAPSAAPTGSAATAGYTLADVAQHAARTDCWTAVDGQVYDLTAWVAKHPGGPGTIAGMCGVDATAAFRGKHGTSGSPTAALARYRKGPLATGAAAAGPGPAGTATAAAAAAPTTRYARAEIARHRTTSNCWSSLEGKVYDLTQWVSQHPGGREGIVEMCGTDGGEFLEQHARDKAAREVLAGFQIGVLAS